MKKFEGILICTDLDGTLLTDDHKVSRENFEAIEYFKSEGGLFTFVTGRMPYYARSLYDMAHPNAPIGCVNGGGIYDFATEKYLWTQALPDNYKILVEHVAENLDNAGVLLNGFDSMCVCGENEATAWFSRITGMKIERRELREVTQPMAKVVFADNVENIERMKTLLGGHPLSNEFDFIRSELNLYEILPKGSSKGALIPKLAEILGVDVKRTVALGDYNNDISMIRAAGLGVAVANAVPEAKAVADIVTVSNMEHAVAKIIYGIDSGKIKI